MTNNLAERPVGHYIGKASTISTRYITRYLVWYEETKYVQNAIDLEKLLKHFTRAQKDELINTTNPEWRFLNEEVLGNWPPTENQITQVKAKWKDLWPKGDL